MDWMLKKYDTYGMEKDDDDVEYLPRGGIPLYCGESCCMLKEVLCMDFTLVLRMSDYGRPSLAMCVCLSTTVDDSIQAKHSTYRCYYYVVGKGRCVWQIWFACSFPLLPCIHHGVQSVSQSCLGRWRRYYCYFDFLSCSYQGQIGRRQNDLQRKLRNGKKTFNSKLVIYAFTRN